METNPNDPLNWKFGIFYFNKNDSRLWVPKRIPQLGFTLNFANRYSHPVLGCIILFMVIVSLLVQK